MAMGNNSQSTIVSPAEDRGARLRQALAATDKALRLSRPENAPLDYAQTQNNRASGSLGLQSAIPTP